MLEALLDRSHFLIVLREHLRDTPLPLEAQIALGLFHDHQLVALVSRHLRAMKMVKLSPEESEKARKEALAKWPSKKAQRAAERAAKAAGDDVDALVKEVIEEVRATARATG